MNRLVKGVTALCVGAALCCAPNAFARKHHHKKKTRFSQVDTNPLANLKTKQPDAELFNKAMKSMRKGRYDVARLELETLLNTYPDSEYAMRAKLAVADSWFKEGGAAALQQAEAEYKDFITFFPNTPEAAEAQMKVGDIYYMQMERPDRDPTNALAAEQQYRTMIEQFPDSTLIPEAKQKLRNVQEVLAQAQFEVGTYYSTIEDWPGAIARLQTVADLYPLYSKVDADLLLMGDDYANEAQAVSRMRMPAKAKTELLKYYNGRAADAWSAIVEKYPMSPNAENAKDRLIAMGLKIPTPTPEALAESEAMEASMVPVKFKTRALDFFSRAGATPVEAVRVGNPTLTDPPQTYAPAIARQQKAVFIAALRNEPLPTANDENQSTVEAQSGPHMATPSEIRAAAKNNNGEQATPTASFEDVPTGNADTTSDTTTVDAQGGVKTSVHQAQPENLEPAGPNRPAEINGAPIAPAVNTPIAGPVGSSGPKALPPAEKPAAAPEQINDVPDTARGHAVNQAANGKHKKKKAGFNSKEESSSKHKKKKGLNRWLNPF
jgi:outer membrane protein assembly factor BamD